MARQKWTNNAKSALAAAIADTDTSLSVQAGDGDLFPTISGTDFFKATLYQISSGQEINHEIVKVTDRIGDVFTIERAQEGTVAQAFNEDDPIQLRLTAGSIDLISVKAVDGGFAGSVYLANQTIDGGDANG